MKITCPNCQKKYTINEAKLPAGVKTAKCKACGQKMPLGKAPAKPSAKPIQVIKITCQYCGQKYKIGQDKIPPRVIAVKCKACGHSIQLPHKAAAAKSDVPVVPRAPQDKAPSTEADLRTQASSAPVTPPRRRKWLFAAAACVLLVVGLGALVKLEIIRVDWLNQLIHGRAEKTAETSPFLDKEPFLALNLNAPEIVAALESHLEPDKKTARLQLMMSMLKSMDLRQVKLYLYSAPNRQLLPVIQLHGSNRQKLEDALNSQESFKKYFTRKSGGNYRLKDEAISDVQKYNLPREPYQVTLMDNGAVLAPVSFSAAIDDNPQILTKSPVAKFAQTVARQQDLATIAIRVPEDIDRGLEKKIQNHPAVQAAPQAAMIAGMGAAIVSQLTGSLKPVDMLALGFRFSGRNGRALSYAQQFRTAVDGEIIYRQLAAADPADSEIDGIIGNLIELFKDQRYQHTLDFKDNRLALEFSWSQKDDEAFLTALTAATAGQLFAGGMELSPTPGEVEIRYAPEPVIVTAVNTEQIKVQLPRMIKENLFPGHYWNREDKPRMTIEMDTVDFPNAAMAELTYEVKSIKSPDGKNVFRVEESKFKPRIQPGSLFPGNISLSVKKGTPPKELAKASIFFHLTLPVALEVFDFAAGDPAGRAKEANGVRATLDRLEKDVARVNSSGGKSMRLIAFDQTGRALASGESMSTPSSITIRFEGIISTLKVVVTREVLEYPFEIEVDLNQGKELVLTREPEIPARMRFNPHPVPTYVNFTAENLDNLTVKWSEGQERSWNDSLSVKLPQGPFSGHAVWEVHFFSNDRPQFLAGNSTQGSSDFSFTLEKGKLKQTSAAFGKVQLNLHSDISRLVFAPNRSGRPATQTLPSGANVSIEFNKNEITYYAGQANVIQTVAYDARGKRLKQDQYTRNKGGKRLIYFWGVPAKFEIDVSTQTIAKLIPFEIKQRPVDEKAFLAFRQTIEIQREVVKTIKKIDRARRRDRSYYGDDLAGLYYLYQRKKKNPQKLIGPEIAHSDPAGQKRFGYKVNPYKGYFFTILYGVENNGVKNGYKRRSKKSSFSWQNGTITAAALTRHPDLVAVPVDKTQPTFFLQWGQVFMKPLNGERLEYLPDGYYNKGWVEAKFINS
ncbi:MAG: hypothetical protein GY850_17070 [bacterium]|nr:hypothetical protein [bacterium]